MPDETHRPIERQLETYARQRRDAAGGPLELHPATRRLLQDEVTRTYGRPVGRARAKGGWLGGLWPRLGWAGPTLAIVAVAFVVWQSHVQPPREQERVSEVERLARLVEPGPPLETQPLKEAAEPAESFARALAPTAPPPTPGRSQDEFRSVRLRSEADALAPTAQPLAQADALTPPPLERAPGRPAVPPAGRAGEKDQLLARGEPQLGPAPRLGLALQQADQLATTDKVTRTAREEIPNTAAPARVQPAAPPAAKSEPARPTESLALADRGIRVAEATAPAAVRFQNTATVANNLAVLNSFQVEQAGAELRFIDADGSTYSGRLVDSAGVSAARASEATTLTLGRDARVPSPRRSAARTKPAAPVAATDQPAPAYNFIAQGTNRSLQQLVVFQGNYRVQTNVAPTTQGAPPQTFYRSAARPDAAARGGQLGGGGYGGLAQQTPALIKGQAIVGGNTTVEVNAIPLPATAPPQK
jgi:hypothetical protein